LAFDKEMTTRPEETNGPGRVVAEVIGNRRNRMSHEPRCPNVGRMKDGNRAAFKTAAEAEMAG